SIINEYKSEIIGTIYHLDLYRLKDAEDAINAGVEDVLYSNNYCFVEWPEKALEIMPDDVCQITMNLIDTDKREIIID
ncbi:MAG: tRNA (adenosine(37)-N6)-threonylcarbamoyltransferase complex ATPase subunit type 1 TsaE, partial [Bacteroidetes bacterium]|nr:tRNA (adenosine(37)-N6)-threonylcarbamoyltransferase complex ATPase subunit type 1 TsaE [Bacteroidota bacterium]